MSFTFNKKIGSIQMLCRMEPPSRRPLSFSKKGKSKGCMGCYRSPKCSFRRLHSTVWSFSNHCLLVFTYFGELVVPRGGHPPSGFKAVLPYYILMGCQSRIPRPCTIISGLTLQGLPVQLVIRPNRRNIS